MKPNARILAVPNEDGFGPSALLSHVVKELLGHPSDYHVTIWNHSRRQYNQTLYQDYIRSRRVDVVPVWNLIQLVKDKETGNVSIPGTLQHIGDYSSASAHYALSAATPDFDLVLDFGVPSAARWAAIRGMPSISIFDHSWAKTMDMILQQADEHLAAKTLLSGADRALWKNLIEDIKEDESFSKQLFLFPEFITPKTFDKHWKELLQPPSIKSILGVLGGHPELKHEKARNHFGFEKDGDIIMIQGGDTGAWVNLISHLVSQFTKRHEELERRNLNVTIFVPSEAKKNEIVVGWLAQQERYPRLREFKPVLNGTIQEVLQVVTLLVTRAGGGTVNDAVACRTPFVCVPEPTQPQVQAIFDECFKLGITRAIDIELSNPASIKHAMDQILNEYDRKADNDALVRKMDNIPEAKPGAESDLVRDILTLV